MDILKEINEHVFALDLKVVKGIFFAICLAFQ